MTLKEIKKKREELASILREENAGTRLEKLHKLAKEVGASVVKMERIETNTGLTSPSYSQENIITESEIVHNIQESLQTETMIEMCRISNRNFWIALIATLISFSAMIAAWVAAFIKQT
jgi:hypothetical protein